MPTSAEHPRSSTALLDAAAHALERLASFDLDTLAGEELTTAVMRLQELRGALDVAEGRVLARWDSLGEWRPSGAKTAAAWLAWKQRIPIGVARQRLRHGRALRDLPSVEKAWAAGEIDRSHLTTMLGKRTPRTEQVFDRDHEVLLDAARSVGFTTFKGQCDRWELLVDPDGAEQGAHDDRSAREVHLSRSFGGMWFGKVTLDPISGEIVHTTLAAIERELFEADWAAGKERLGREPTVLDLERTPAQRRATRSSRWPLAPAPRLATVAVRPRCSRCSSAMRPSPVPCSSCSTALCSRPGPLPRGSPRPTSNVWCSRDRHG
ncbi:MAG: DUF222 domain-containing protein [Acidimicrobiales bacterium]